MYALADKRNACFRAVLFASVLSAIRYGDRVLFFCSRYQRLMEKGDEKRAESMINRPLFRYTAHVFGKPCLSLFFATVN